MMLLLVCRKGRKRRAYNLESNANNLNQVKGRKESSTCSQGGKRLMIKLALRTWKNYDQHHTVICHSLCNVVQSATSTSPTVENRLELWKLLMCCTYCRRAKMTMEMWGDSKEARLRIYAMGQREWRNVLQMTPNSKYKKYGPLSLQALHAPFKQIIRF